MSVCGHVSYVSVVGRQVGGGVSGCVEEPVCGQVVVFVVIE